MQKAQENTLFTAVDTGCCQVHIVQDANKKLSRRDPQHPIILLPMRNFPISTYHEHL